MKPGPRFSATVIGLLLVWSTGALAQPAGGPVMYRLDRESAVEIGCQPPCKCPIWRQPLGGSFRLEPLGFDGLFHRFAVTEVDWVLFQTARETRITGSGTYRVGGEFAAQHQITLDLAFSGGPEQRFDSGLMLGGSGFPKVAIEAAVNRFFCFDTVMVLRAGPVVAAAGPEPSDGSTRARVRPNPFLGRTDVDFTLPQPGFVDLRVFDIQGREVRALLAWRWVSAGSHTFPWDGRDMDGRNSVPGVYWVRLSSENREDWVRLVKLAAAR